MDRYEAWLTAALRETEDRARWGAPWLAASRRTAVEMVPQRRAAVVLDHVVAALADEARIEAALGAAADGR